MSEAMNVLVVAEADDQRALAPRADQQLGLVGAHRDECEVAVEARESRAHGRHEVAVVETAR